MDQVRQVQKGHYIKSFRLRVEGKQKGGDDTAANDVEFTCTNGKKLRTTIGKRQPTWGKWRNGQSCPKGSAVSFVKSRVEKWTKKDYTGLNGLAIGCSKLHKRKLLKRTCKEGFAQEALFAKLAPLISRQWPPRAVIALMAIVIVSLEAMTRFDVKV